MCFTLRLLTATSIAGADRSGIVQTLDLGSGADLETVWASSKTWSWNVQQAQPSSSQKVSSVQSDGDADDFFDALSQFSHGEDTLMAEADVMDASLDEQMTNNILESGLRLQDTATQGWKFSSNPLFNRVDGNTELAKLCSVLKGSSRSQGRIFTSTSNSSCSTQIPKSDVGTFEAYERSRIVAALTSKPNLLTYSNKYPCVGSTTSVPAIPAKRLLQCCSSQFCNPGNIPNHFLESGSGDGWAGTCHDGPGEDIAHINGNGNHVFRAAGNVGASFSSHQLNSGGPASTPQPKSAPGFTASLALLIFVIF